MPALQIRTVAAQAVLAGDAIDGYTVTGVDAKVKWVYIGLEGVEKPLKLERDAQVQVARLLETEEEKAARDLDARLQWLDDRGVRARRDLVRAQAELAKRLNDGLFLDYRAVSDLAVAQETARLWARVDHVSRVRCDDGLTRLEALEVVKEKVREELLGTSFGYCSTDVMSNGFDAAVQKAKSRFLSSW